MYLCIDPAVRDCIRITVHFSQHFETHEYHGRNREILHALLSILEVYNLTMRDVSGIVVIIGEGGFSSTRVACVVANTLSFALGVRVMSIRREEYMLHRDHMDTLFIPITLGDYISAEYSGEPNIGTHHA